MNENAKGHLSGNRHLEEARYANFFQIGHNAFEFLIEFGQQEGEIHTRIYISPQHATILAKLLQDTLYQHQRIFGPIHNLASQE